MSNNQPGASSSPPINEIKKTVSLEDLEERVTIDVDLRPGQNRLVIRVGGAFVFSI